MGSKGLPGAARLCRELKIMVHATIGAGGTDVQRKCEENSCPVPNPPSAVMCCPVL